jgi:type III secretion protein L
MDEKIIKAASPVALPLGSGRVVKKEVYSASREAEEIVERAREEAEAIRQEAAAEAARIKSAAQEEGYTAGLAQWNEIVAAALAARDEFLRESEREVVRLAVRIAEKIIGERLAAAPDTIVGIVREALKSVHRERSLVIRVHTQYVELVKQRVRELADSLGGSREIQVAGSPDVPPGGCLVESELGKIDARLETQLRVLEELLLRAGKP